MFDRFVSDDTPHEECGVFGVYDLDGADCAEQVYYGLFALQHRGQESCGIAANDCGVVSYYKDMGLVPDVLTKPVLDTLHGDIAIGHVRYSTAGGSLPENAQPLVMRYSKGTLAIAHNGNLANTAGLRKQLEKDGAIFQTTIDSELIAYAVAKSRLQCHSVEKAVELSMQVLQGSYSLLVMSPRKLIAARDPWGIRPLCIGKAGNAWYFASESCALDAVGAEFVRDVKPGEIITIDQNGFHSNTENCQEKCSHCIFEYIYFARPDSRLDGVSVAKSREMAGRSLARQKPVDAEGVVGGPASGLVAAAGYSMESGIPCVKGFVKNNYVGRTFIKPSQNQRVDSVRIKLNPLRENVEGKRVIMIDDSIVRGTTSARIVKLLKDAGAKEVHVRISSPPFLYPCYFGTDVPSSEELAATGRSVEEVGKLIGADSLDYLDVNSLNQLIDSNHYCHGCFTGSYPIRVEPEDEDWRFKKI